MKLFIIIPLFSLLFSQEPNKYLEGIEKRSKSLDVTDRKYGDHNGNRIFNRFYNELEKKRDDVLVHCIVRYRFRATITRFRSSECYKP